MQLWLTFGLIYFHSIPSKSQSSVGFRQRWYPLQGKNLLSSFGRVPLCPGLYQCNKNILPYKEVFLQFAKDEDEDEDEDDDYPGDDDGWRYDEKKCGGDDE